MITTEAPRRRAGQRVASAIWGLLVIGAGIMMAVAFSGTDIDLELAAIIALGAVGLWLLLSAALSSLGRSREVREATAPVQESAYVAPSEPTPTEVLFTEASAPPKEAADTADPAPADTPDTPDTLNRFDGRHADDEADAELDTGVSEPEPVQSEGAEGDEGQQPPRS